jgi:hypothetical protein
VLNGFARIFYTNGDYYTGEFKDNVRHGKGKHIYKSGKIMDGLWLNNKLIL